MKDATPRQSHQLRVLFNLQSNGRPPTYREMCAALGVASTNAIRDLLDALVAKGLIFALPHDGTARRRLHLTPRGEATIGIAAHRPYTLAEWDSTDEPDLDRIRATIEALEQRSARRSA